MPKTFKHLFEKVVTLENLFASAHAAMRGRRGRISVARCFAQQEKIVVSLHEELLAGTWQPGQYRYFMISDPKEREVAAAPLRDRIVHHALVRVLEPIFDPRFIADSFACRKGRGTHAGLARAREFTRRYRYCLKCDIRKYFPSIDHALLLAQLRRAVADPRVLDLLTRIITSHADGVSQHWQAGGSLFDVTERSRGLPIGNLTSQFFANIYLHPLDLFVKHELRVKGYLRYVDDFLLFGNDRAALKTHGRRIREFVKMLRLSLHPDKFRLTRTDQGVDFVGFVCFPCGRIRVRDDNVRRFVRRLNLQAWLVRTGAMEVEDLRTRALSWIAHAGHAQSRGLRRDIFKKICLSGHRDTNVRGLRGGAYNNNDNNLASSNRNNNNPDNENNNIGFRVSSLRTGNPPTARPVRPALRSGDPACEVSLSDCPAGHPADAIDPSGSCTSHPVSTADSFDFSAGD